MTTAIEYALMAGHAYRTNRDEINWIPAPQGWTPFFPVPDPTTAATFPTTSGFEAVSFTNGTEIVISFAGTDFSLEGISDFTNANIPLVLGIVSEQLKQAAEYYLQVKALNPGAQISLTGHSLGGGLAALVGVFFGETAFTFDQAPFAQTAKLSATVLKSYLLTDGYTEAELSNLTNFISLQESNGGIPNEGLVTNLNVQGEIVSLGSALRIGNSASIPQGTPFDPLDVSFAIDLHSEALLSALLQSNQSAASGQSLSEVTAKLPDLLKMIFSDQLFAHSVDKSNTTEENFLERLVRHEAGVGATATGSPILADAMVTRFTSDLWKVAQDGGFTLTNTHIANTLVAFAMQMYYENPEAAVVGKTLFTDVTGGIRFDRTDVSASLFNAKGWQLYFQNYLAEELTFEEHQIVERLLPAATDWFIQAGNVSMSATADVSKAFMVGGIGNDWMVGGSEADLLIGNEGDDTLNGGVNDDTLIGGAGLDTYIINAGGGYDSILDSDGLGVITIGGVEAKGSAGLDPSKWIHAVGTDIWTDAQNSITYTKSAASGETWLLIHKGDSNVVVKGWADGELGIQLGASEPPLAPVTSETIGGTDGQDFLYGSANNDLIFGLAGVDYLSGLDGDDVLEGGAGNDIIAGGSTSDNDTLKGDDGDDLILGDGAVAATSGTDPATLARNNLLTGIQTTIGADGFMSYTYVQPDDISVGQAYAPGGEDILYGGQGNDVIEAGGQNDYVDGGIGADRLYGMGGQDILLGQEGNDILVGDNVNDNFDFGDDILSGGADNDRLWGAGGNDYLEGGTGDDYLEGDGNLDAAHDGADVLVGGDGNDSLVGGGKDDLLFGGTGNDGLLGQAGNDMLYGEAGTDYLDGGEGDDYLDGGEGIDTLLGGVGNDTLVGGAGDTLDGGEGDDTYIIDGQMTVEISDNQGENTLEVSGEFDLSSVELSVGGSGETINMYLDGLLITFTNGSVFTVISQGDIHSLETLVAETITTPVDLTQTSVGGTLYGGSGNDSITGGAGVDTLHGHGGNDSIYGGDNNDILDGGNGFDSLYGGAGNDLLLGGDSADKYIDGVTNFGADLLDGGSGADKMMGGQGRDIYIVDDVDDLVIENSNEGTDHVDSSVTYTLSANVESLVLSGANAINGIGNELDNSLQSVFSSVSNILSGLGGNDVILVGNWDTALGGDGNDVLYGSNGFVAEFIAAPVYLWGEAGDDSLQGAYGDDTLDGGSGDDAVSGGSGHDNITGGPGKNYLFGDHSATILTSDIIGNDVIAGGDDYDFVRAGAGNDSVRGNGGDDDLGGDFGEDTLFGGQGNDTLDGGAGADTLVGGAGDDTYIINYWIGDAVDIVTEELNEGVDTVYAGMTYTLGKNVENLILTGVQTWSSRTYVVGSLGQAVMEIDPNSFDPLAINGTGNALNNMLTGNSAANTLSGGAGVDTMIGGGGNDTYVVADIGDLVAENLNEGTDLVQSSVTYALTANVENLTLTGKNAINGMGNELNNMLIGNKAANILTGGMGDDVYFVDNALDLVVEATNEGIDSVNSSVAFTLGANVENLFLTGKGPVNGTGNTLDNVLVGTGAANVLTGGAGNDRLDGGAGSDKMIGGIGDDTYVVNVSKDAITEKANEGTDTVESSVTLTLVANVENLTLTGTSAVNGTGNALNNVLKGNSAVNSLTGAAGNDTLEGMGGNDILTGGTGNDTYTVGRGYGTDTVVENDATSGNVDVAQFLTGVGADQIWFQQVGNNLETSIIGTTDKLVISDWYLGSDNHVEQFKTTDGAMTLLDSNVQNLVNAMASFAPPAAGQTSLPTDYQASLATVIAANWQ